MRPERNMGHDQGSTGPKEVVSRIREGLDASRDTRIWPEYVRALNLISQVIFTRSAGFVLELVQNAEDAGRGVTEGAGRSVAGPGRFEVSVNASRVKITHNGRPFDAADVQALCGIRSSKKPEQGTLGYLGIGFKSVFKITHAPEVYSGGYRFKFDRNDPTWAGREDAVPWHVSPIWLASPSESIDPSLTTFILPFRNPGSYEDLVAELRRLDTGLFLFLRWLRAVRMVNEETGEERTLENLGEDRDGITTLRQGKLVQRFKVFRKAVSVPARVMDDELTRTYRRGVRQREIALAFAVGAGGELDATGSTCAFGGIYSFMPLGEVKSGARYRIQADFLVQPGRDAVNHEAEWNRWLVREVATLSSEALSAFSEHPAWRYQVLPVFEFTRLTGDDAHDHLFGPLLMEPVEKELRGRPIIPTVGGGKAALGDLVRLTEEDDAAAALTLDGLLSPQEVATVLGGRPGLAVMDSRVAAPSDVSIPKINRWNLLKDEAFLKAKAASPDGPDWFRRLYLWLHRYPWHDLLPDGRRAKKEKRYHGEDVVLGEDGKLYSGGDVWLPGGMLSSKLLEKLAEDGIVTKPVCHHGVLAGTDEEGAGGRVAGFLSGMCGVQRPDHVRICKEWVLPSIRSDAPKPSLERLMHYTRVCFETLPIPPGAGTELWVLGKDGEIRPAKEILFSSEYRPPFPWEPLRRYLPRAVFLSPAYIDGAVEQEELAEWRAFLGSAGMRPAPANGVEEVAMAVTIEALKKLHPKVSPVHTRDLGYDLEVETIDHETLRVEVKGLADEGDVELTPNETQAADRYQESYLLCIVAPIPRSPHLHMIRYPTARGKGAKYSLKVPASVWREARWAASPRSGVNSRQ